MTDEKSQPGFWHTIPGILTATATVVTALTGFVGALYQAGILGHTNNESALQPNTDKPVLEQPTVQASSSQIALPTEPEKQTIAQSAPEKPVSDHGANSKSQQDKILPLSGRYSVQGKNPKGGSFTGQVSIVGQGGLYELTFDNRNKTFHGKGVLEGNVLQVKWEHRFVTYTLRENGELEGTWDNGAGSEILAPISN